MEMNTNNGEGLDTVDSSNLHAIDSEDVPQFNPHFADPPMSGTKEYQTHMVIQQKKDPAETLPFGVLPMTGKDKTARQRNKQPPPDDWYVPATFPFTHTNIHELGDWPQRLLHVETMTSYEWTPGNIYGTCKEPLYRAVSYTWGRWRLPDDAGDNGGADFALAIHGVPWTVPRINPDHFCPAQLAQILQHACATAPTVAFVWLDIACIDQRRGPTAALEVGRQAGIFRRSSGVAVWLTRTGRDDTSIKRLARRLGLLESTVTKLRDARSRLKVREADDDTSPLNDLHFDQKSQAEILDGVKEMLCDPWFTGLWTLQEAFLSKRAFFLLARQHLRVERPATGSSTSSISSEASLYLLDEFAESCRQVLRYSRRKEIFASCDRLDDFRNELEEWVQISGINAMARHGNPLNLLTIAGRRWTSREEDHIYGISQVFGYRLGNTRPNAQVEDFYDRAELELELGITLLDDRQSQSQLFVFTESPDQGQGWRISSSCHIHHDFHNLFNWSSPREDQQACQLSTQLVGETPYGHFRGSLASLSELNAAWNKFEGQILMQNGQSQWSGFRRFYPDVTELFADSVERQRPIYIPEDRSRHRAFGVYLDDKFSKNHLAVLYLGHNRDRHLGLLLVYVRVGGVLYWYRIGLIIWYIGDLGGNEVSAYSAQQEASGTEDLQGRGQIWHPASGIYG